MAADSFNDRLCHQQACYSSKKSTIASKMAQALGWSCRGFSTKIYGVCDRSVRPVRFYADRFP